jgi:hypothetical protein
LRSLRSGEVVSSAKLVRSAIPALLISGLSITRTVTRVRIPPSPPAWPKQGILCAKMQAIEPNISSNFRFGFRTSKRQSPPILLRMAQFSPDLWTPPIWYGSRNSNVSRCLCILIKWGSVALLEQARASDFEIAVLRFEPAAQPGIPPFGQAP